MASGGDGPAGGVMKEGWLQKRGMATKLFTRLCLGEEWLRGAWGYALVALFMHRLGLVWFCVEPVG